MSGDVSVVGTFRISLTVRPTALPEDTLRADGVAEDAFAMRLAGTSGQTVWARRFGGPGGDWANGVAVDDDDNVYLTGRFTETVTFKDEPRASVGLADVFLVKVSGGGTPAWDRVWGGTGDDDGYGVAIDYANSDDLVVGGGMDGTVDFGEGFVLTSARQDGFVARFRSDGSGPMWVRQYGGDEDDTVYDLAVAPGTGHEIVAVGSFRQTIDFGGGFVLTSMGEEDTFVLALAP
jgi:hypothetical protein